MPKSAKNWIVKVNIETDAIESLSLFDAKDIFGHYLAVRRDYFDELSNSFSTSKKNIGEKIHEVIGSDGKNWTNNPWILIMARDTDKKAPFWILLKRESDLTGYVIAIGPSSFYSYMISSKENVEEIQKIMDYLINQRHKFTRTLLLPDFMTSVAEE